MYRIALEKLKKIVKDITCFLKKKWKKLCVLSRSIYINKTFFCTKCFVRWIWYFVLLSFCFQCNSFLMARINWFIKLMIYKCECKIRFRKLTVRRSYVVYIIYRCIHTAQQNYRMGNFMSKFRINSNKHNSVKDAEGTFFNQNK